MYIIALIGIGFFLYGFIMLVITAFKVTKVWGITVLLVPFAQVFFPVYHWEKSKSAFSSFILGISLWLGTAIIFGEGALDQYWLESVTQVQSAETVQSNEQLPLLSLEQRSEKYKSLSYITTQSNIPFFHKKRYHQVSMANLPKFTGHYIEIKLYNNVSRTGILEKVTADSVELHNYIGSGNLSYSVPLYEINTILIEVDG